MPENIEIRMATMADLPALIDVGDALFDYAVKPDRAAEFINDNRHHLIIALDGDKIVGMASGLHYVHPDKDPSLFINEVSVLDDYHNRGIGRAVVAAMKNHGATLGCTEEIWVATEISNTPARRCYMAAGGVEDEEQAVVFNFDGE